MGSDPGPGVGEFDMIYVLNRFVFMKILLSDVLYINPLLSLLKITIQKKKKKKKKNKKISHTKNKKIFLYFSFLQGLLVFLHF